MKNGNFRFFILSAFGIAVLVSCLRALGADEISGLTLIESEEAQDMVDKVWLMLAPFLAFVGAARLLLKPVFTWMAGGMEKVITKADQTDSARDDELLDGLLSSKGYFWFAWLVDLLFSVKLPVKRKPVADPS